MPMISMIYYHYFEIIVPESIKQPYRRVIGRHITIKSPWVFNDGRVPRGLIDIVNSFVLKGLLYKHSSRATNIHITLKLIKLDV